MKVTTLPVYAITVLVGGYVVIVFAMWIYYLY